MARRVPTGSRGDTDVLSAAASAMKGVLGWIERPSVSARYDLLCQQDFGYPDVVLGSAPSLGSELDFCTDTGDAPEEVTKTSNAASNSLLGMAQRNGVVKFWTTCLHLGIVSKVCLYGFMEIPIAFSSDENSTVLCSSLTIMNSALVSEVQR